MAFHGFEVLLALVQVDLLKEEHPENPSMRDRAPLRRFAIMHYRSPETSALSQLRLEYEAANHEWGP
jgi:hypothetical protein